MQAQKQFLFNKQLNANMRLVYNDNLSNCHNLCTCPLTDNTN